MPVPTEALHGEPRDRPPPDGPERYLGTGLAPVLAPLPLAAVAGVSPSDPALFVWLAHGWGWGHLAFGGAWVWLTRDPMRPDYAAACALGAASAGLGATGVPLQPGPVADAILWPSLAMDAVVLAIMGVGLWAWRALRPAD